MGLMRRTIVVLYPKPPACDPSRAACRRPMATVKGVAGRPGVGPVRQHPARLRRPVATLQRLVRRRGPTPPAGEPLTVARYLAARAGSGASIATLRLATSAIAKAHEWSRLESPCRDQGVRASLKGWGKRLSKPQRQAGALTADVLAVIRPHLRPNPVAGVVG